MNEFNEIDRALAEAFADRPSTLSRPSLRDVRQRARRHQRQRKAGVVGACAIVGVGGAAVLATRSPVNQTAVGDSTANTICFPTASILMNTSTVPFNTLPTTTGLATSRTIPIDIAGYYVVQAGDNPASVADAFRVTIEALNAANHLTPDYDIFYVGLEIAIPHPNIVGGSTTVPAPPLTYTIAAGDYPGSVAEMFRVTVAELDAVNQNTPGYGGFIVGTVIYIPLASPYATTTTNVTASGVPPTTLFPEPTAWTTTTLSAEILTIHHVQQGDTPIAVANAFDVTLLELDAANVDTPGYAEWLVGTAVRIPNQGAPATTSTAFTSSYVPSTAVYMECFPVAESTMPEPAVTTAFIDTSMSPTTSSTIPSFTKIGTAIQVINCSNQEGSARFLSDALAAEGFTMVEVDTGTIALPVTKVLYNPDDPAAYQVALTLAVYLGNATVEPSGPILPNITLGTWAPGSGVVVLLGDNFAGKSLFEIANTPTFTAPTNFPTSTST